MCFIRRFAAQMQCPHGSWTTVAPCDDLLEGDDAPTDYSSFTMSDIINLALACPDRIDIDPNRDWNGVHDYHACPVCVTFTLQSRTYVVCEQCELMTLPHYDWDEAGKAWFWDRDYPHAHEVEKSVMAQPEVLELAPVWRESYEAMGEYLASFEFAREKCELPLPGFFARATRPRLAHESMRFRELYGGDQEPVCQTANAKTSVTEDLSARLEELIASFEVDETY